MLDKHQWDGYFALFAKDASTPWKPTTIRLDTYSGAPVDFAAYAVDPAEVIVAGGNRSARAIETSKRQPAAHWRFSPPPGYRFEMSDVSVPLGSNEGFYVIEARRGDAAQQVWINRSRIGLVTKESPEGLVLWGVDLRNGHPMRGLRVEFLAGGTLVPRTVDRDGLIAWRDRRRATFALAQSGASRAFVSLLPQAPVPQAIVGVRVESAVVRAGAHIRAFGFARRRAGAIMRNASGEARLTVVGAGKVLAASSARLDAAGAFAADVPVPLSANAGDYAVLASASGGVAGTAVHVDAAANLSLAISAACPCDARSAVPLTVTATRDGAPQPQVAVAITIVRTPHIVPPGEPDDAPRWGTSTALKTSVTTGNEGRARVDIPPPTDGLASTYGIRAATRGDGATATAQIAVPTAPIALAIEPDAAAVDVGQAVGFTVRGFASADGAPESGLGVTLRLSHGATVAQQTVHLDERGRAHAVFREPRLGSNLAVADAVAADGRHALDAASVNIAPRGLSGVAGSAEGSLSLALDRMRYRPGDRVGVTVSAPGSEGEALVTLDGARTYATRIVAIANGRAATSFQLPSVEGDVRVGAAVVHDGSIALASVPLDVDAPGHARALSLSPDRSAYGPGEVAKVAVRDGDASLEGTLLVRLTDARPSGGAALEDMPAVLRAGGTSSQDSAAENPAWHAWVAPAKSKASDIFAAERPRQVRHDLPSIGSSAPRTLAWRVEHMSAAGVDVPLPLERGTYVLSMVGVFDDGDVGAASTSLLVR